MKRTRTKNHTCKAYNTKIAAAAPQGTASMLSLTTSGLHSRAVSWNGFAFSGLCRKDYHGNHHVAKQYNSICLELCYMYQLESQHAIMRGRLCGLGILSSLSYTWMKASKLPSLHCEDSNECSGHSSDDEDGYAVEQAGGLGDPVYASQTALIRFPGAGHWTLPPLMVAKGTPGCGGVLLFSSARYLMPS